MGQVVWGDGNRDAITGNDLDVKTTKPPTDAGEKRVPLVALHAEMSARKRLDHSTLDLDQIISCHNAPFCPTRARTITMMLRAGTAEGRYKYPYNMATQDCRPEARLHRTDGDFLDARTAATYVCAQSNCREGSWDRSWSSTAGAAGSPRRT